MHVHETLWRQVGWLGWLAWAALIAAWADIAFTISGDARAWYWIAAAIVMTPLMAWFTYRDWRKVQARRATIARITRRTHNANSRRYDA